jgi:FlaA1/EpsC-like NDP-sugar epimerase
MTVLAEKEDVSTTTRPRLADQLSKVVAANLLLDCVVVLTAILVGWEYRALMDAVFPGAPRVNVAGVLTPMLLVVWIGLLGARGAYRRHNVGAGFDEFRSVLQGSALAFGLTATLAFLFDAEFSRRFLVLALLIGTPLLFLERYAVRKAVHFARRRGHLRGRVLVVGTPLALSELVSTLDRVHSVGYSIVGTVLPEREAAHDLALPVPLFGGVDDIVSACREAHADTVIVAGGGMVSSSMLRRIGWNLEGQDIDLVVVPSLIDVAGPRPPQPHDGGTAGIQPDDAGAPSVRS